MNFHNVRLPLWLSNQFQINLNSDTPIVKTSNGQEYRRHNHDYLLKTFIAKNFIVNRLQYQELVNFYNLRCGKTYSFRFKDNNNYEVKGQTIATGDNSQTKFELCRIIQDQANFIKKKVLPDKSSIKVEINNEVVDFDYNELDNIITLKSPLRDYESLRASFEYDLKVRFDTQNLNYANEINGCLKIQELKVKEITV